MNVDAYLERIGYEGPREPTIETLTGLHRAHMLSVPFENLDIHLGRRLVLDRPVNFAKIVDHRRGGWCYELNGLFGWLLEQLGFRVFPSEANFVLARRPGVDQGPVARALAARDILVRHFAQPGLEDALRITVGTDAEIDALLAALAAL